MALNIVSDLIRKVGVSMDFIKLFLISTFLTDYWFLEVGICEQLTI